MIDIAIRTATDHQETLRSEAARARAASSGSASTLRDRFAAVASIARSAFGGPDVAPGSVFPATH